MLLLHMVCLTHKIYDRLMAVGNDSIALGTMSVAGTTSGNVNAIAIGKGAQALGNQSISIGTGNVVTGHNSGAIGDPTYIDADSSYGIGNNNAITSAAPNAFILGNNNVVNSSNTYVLGSNVNNSATAGATPVPYGKTAENSVYLGDNSTASTASGIGTANLTRTYTAGTTTTGGLTGTVDTATVQGITYGGFAGKTSVGVVSVGAAGEERRIQNVAAGEISATSTDAINGSQLYATADKLVTTGLNFTDAAGTNIVHKDLGGTLPIIGATTQVAAGLSADAAVAGPYTAKNVQTFADKATGQIQVQMADNPVFSNVQATTLTTTGAVNVGGPLTVTGGTTLNGPLVVNNTATFNQGADMAGNKIVNVAKGTDDTDAVNVSQLNQLKTDGLNFSGNEGSTVHRDLGQTLAIRGLASAAGSYSGTNLKTVTDSATGAIQLQMADSPKFGNVTINADGGGKITGVTAGTAATDAVNVSQLNNVQQIANKGWTLATDAGTASNVKPGDTVQLTNTDGNILISNTGNTATFNLANNLNVDSVNAGGTIINNQGLTAGNTTVTSNGLTIQGGPSVTQGGINAAGTTITNVKAGVADTDAVNVSQLKDVANVANAGWDIGNADGKVGNVAPGKRVDFVAGNTSTRVDVTQDVTGTSKVTVSAAPSALQYTTTNTAAGGNTPAADPFTSTSQVTLVGPNGDTSSGVTINNVAPATLSADSKQAVNGSQLHQAGQNIANVLGGSSTYNATTNTVNAGLNVGGKTYTTVNDALQAVDLTANKGWNLQANGGTSSHIAGNDTVNVVDGKNTTVSLRDKQLQVNVVDNPTFTGEVTLQGGTTVGDHLTVQKGATVNMGGNTINNVAPGEVSATSTQAVNGSQLFAVDQKISNLGDQINGVAKDAYAGVANAIATASIPQVTMPGAKGVAVAGGTYHGQSSMAVGVSGMSDNGKWIFKGNLSTNTQGHLGAGVGALYQWR